MRAQEKASKFISSDMKKFNMFDIDQYDWLLCSKKLEGQIYYIMRKPPIRLKKSKKQKINLSIWTVNKYDCDYV